MNLGRYVGNHATGAVDWSGLYQDGGAPPGNDEPLFGVNGINGRQPIISFRPFGERTFGTPTNYENPDLPSPRIDSAVDGSWFGGVLDWIQGGLDVGGTFEPTPVCDIVNSGICVARGKWSDAGLTIAGVVPYFGDAGKAVKHGKKLVEGTAGFSTRLPWSQISSDYRSIIRDVEAHTRRGIPRKQRSELSSQIRGFNHRQPVSEDVYRKLQAEYQNKRSAMIEAWEKNTGQLWPKGAQAHHIIPTRYGGPNEWWNLHPADRGVHQRGIHGLGGSTQKVFPTPIPRKQ